MEPDKRDSQGAKPLERGLGRSPELILSFDEQHPCRNAAMAELAGHDPVALDSLVLDGLLEKETDIYFLSPAGLEAFRQLAEESFIPSRPGSPGADKRREADRSLLQTLLDKRHTQRWGIKEYVKPFRFEVPDLSQDELFSLDGRGLTWRYQEHKIFLNMANDFPVTGLAARALPQPTPERAASWLAENVPRRRTMEADLLYKSRYDFQAYASFPKLPCDPCGLLDTDRFMCFFAPSPAPENERAILTKLGEFHMYLTMLRRVYMPGYADLDSLDQDAVNRIMFVYVREADAAACAELLKPHAQNLAGPAAPLEVWSLSLEAMLNRKGTAETIHDLLPEIAHTVQR